MKNLLIFTITLTAACAAEFNPDLSETSDSGGPGGGPGGGSGTAGSGDSDDTGDDTGPWSLDMNEGSGTAGDGDASSTSDTDSNDTEESGETGPSASCGDGIAEEGEECDGSDLLEATCEDGEYYGGGEVGCSTDCSLDFSACEEMVYVQTFPTAAMPAEIELVGEPTAFPLIVTGSLEVVDGNPWGNCFNGIDDHCLQTGPAGDSQMTGFQLTFDFVAPGEVRFWTWGWTEKYDEFQFSIDGTLVHEESENFLAPQEWVGTVDTPGYHVITWAYWKDSSLSSGFDKVWVDSITVTNGELW